MLNFSCDCFCHAIIFVSIDFLCSSFRHSNVKHRRVRNKTTSSIGQIELAILFYSKLRAESTGDFLYAIKTTDNAQIELLITQHI